MTEEEWVVAADTIRMLDIPRVKPGGRKLPLFACACCRRIWHRIPDPRSRYAIEVVEQYLDGETTGADLDLVRHDAELAEQELRSHDWRLAAGAHAVVVTTLYRVWTDSHGPCVATVVQNTKSAAAFDAEVKGENKKKRRRKWSQGYSSEAIVHADFLRDIFGNPFRPVAFVPEWRTSSAVALADAMYQSRDFGPMPILADALEEAGCTNADILSHCRGDGPHVRGCWVVDLVLGKS